MRETVGDLGLKLVFEPGRLIVGNAGILVTRVLYVKPGPVKSFAIVDGAMNDLIRPTLYSAHHDIVPVRAPAKGAALRLSSSMSSARSASPATISPRIAPCRRWPRAI